MSDTGELRCGVCNLAVTGAAAWEQHVTGKRHMAKQAHAERMAQEASMSVYVTKFKPGPAAPDQVRDALAQFGTIKKVLIDPAKVCMIGPARTCV